MVLDSFLVGMIYHADLFANVEPPLHPRHESYLVMMDNPFNVLLDPINYDCVVNFGVHIHQGYRSVILPFGGVFVWFRDQGNAGLIEFGSFPSLSIFFKQLQKNRC